MVFGVEGYTWYLLIEDFKFCNFQMQIDYLNICEPNQNQTNLHLYIIYVIFTFTFCPHVLYYLSMYNFCF
jgi:hypothetical protein